MKASADEMERQVKGILDSVEDGVAAIDRYGRPWVQRNRITVVAIGAAVMVGVAAAVVISRRRRRRTLVARLEGPISSIRSAAERLAR